MEFYVSERRSKGDRFILRVFATVDEKQKHEDNRPKSN